MNAFRIIIILMTIICFFCSSFAQNYVKPKKPMKFWTKEQIKNFWENQSQVNFLKPTGPSDRREGIMDGNKIRTVFYNYGSVGRPNWEPSIEWPKESGHGYAYEFGPIIGAEVVDIYGDTISIFSDALVDGGDTAPSGKVLGWQPLPQYLNPTAQTPAMSNNPASWPQTQNTSNPFYNVNNTSTEDMFLWPGLDSLGTQSADLEAFWIMDDRDNDEFAYYPFVNDSLRRGLGVELTCRLLQFTASLAEDIIFYIVTVKNVSDKPLNKVVVGMFGDPHIGGPGDFSDDFADFDISTNTVYAWDAIGSGNDYSIPWNDLGWLGFKFLESPKDSLGNELGLTSMSAPLYATSFGDPSNDEQMWENMTPGYFSNIENNQDNVFIFGTGYFSLMPGESQQFSVAILMGKGLDDLNANGTIAQDIYNLSYKFTKAPISPKLTVVPDDGKVTLYWDTRSEKSFDDFFQTYDFEGYKIYRSTNKIDWGEPITDVNGAIKFYKPLAQFDIDNQISGFFPKQELGTNFFLGENTGLKHTFVDENVINGVTYYYAVTAYDSGYASLDIQPAESGREVGVNMQSVFPRSNAPGYREPLIDLSHSEGYSSGKIDISVIDPNKIDGTTYNIFFTDTSTAGKTFNIYYENPVNNDTVYVIENSANIFNDPVIFGGIIATFNDETQINVVDSLTAWTEGSNSTLEPVSSLYPNGVAIPRDIEIRFYDTIVDTTILVNPKPVKFEVWNATDNEKMKIIFFDTNNNDTVNIGDQIVPIIYVNNVPKGTWQVKLFAPLDSNLTAIPPANGDVLKVFVSKPFETIDKYTITTEPAYVNSAQAKTEFLSKIAVVPNPYIVTSSFEVPPPTVFSQGRGDRRIDFIHLPPKCTIRIYTTNGELIRILEHNVDIYDDRESWDLLTSEGLEIAYGIYVYHVDAGELGEKIGKFAIIK